jgi:hypothetical protein
MLEELSGRGGDWGWDEVLGCLQRHEMVLNLRYQKRNREEQRPREGMGKYGSAID